MPDRIRADRFKLQNPGETVERVKRFLRTHKERTKARTLVLGLSGGLDSCVTAAVCSMAVGGHNVIGVSMPEKETWNKANIEDAQYVARKFGVRFKLVDITELVDSTQHISELKRKHGDRVAFGNVKARVRGLVLYYFANFYGGLVVGTGDKSETMLGYFTKYGDGACDMQPLADMYKTTVGHLAKYLGIPARVYAKQASPGLWPGQTAEGELGMSYERLDMILWGLERWMSPADIALDTGLQTSTICMVRKRWIGSEHKRRPPLSLKLGYRTAGSDLRLPYSV